MSWVWGVTGLVGAMAVAPAYAAQMQVLRLRCASLRMTLALNAGNLAGRTKMLGFLAALGMTYIQTEVQVLVKVTSTSTSVMLWRRVVRVRGFVG